MYVPLYTAIADAHRSIRKSFTIEGDNLSIGKGPCQISEDGEILFGSKKPRSLKETATLLGMFIDEIYRITEELQEKANNLKDVLSDARRMNRYVEKKDRSRYLETCKKANEALSDMEMVIDNLQKTPRIKRENAAFFGKEAWDLMASTFHTIHSVLERYRTGGITIEPAVINVKVEVMGAVER